MPPKRDKSQGKGKKGKKGAAAAALEYVPEKKLSENDKLFYTKQIDLLRNNTNGKRPMVHLCPMTRLTEPVQISRTMPRVKGATAKRTGASENIGARLRNAQICEETSGTQRRGNRRFEGSTDRIGTSQRTRERIATEATEQLEE